MSAAAYLWGAVLFMCGLLGLLVIPALGMPHELSLVAGILAGAVMVVGAIMFLNEICHAIGGRSLFG